MFTRKDVGESNLWDRCESCRIFIDVALFWGVWLWWVCHVCMANRLEIDLFALDWRKTCLTKTTRLAAVLLSWRTLWSAIPAQTFQEIDRTRTRHPPLVDLMKFQQNWVFFIYFLFTLKDFRYVFFFRVSPLCFPEWSSNFRHCCFRRERLKQDAIVRRARGRKWEWWKKKNGTPCCRKKRERETSFHLPTTTRQSSISSKFRIVSEWGSTVSAELQQLALSLFVWML